MRAARDGMRAPLTTLVWTFAAITAEPALAHDWDFGVTPYLWGAGIDGIACRG
ncbi:MAG: hypothetical protein ACWGPN_15325 [Gammaproteobacteria bacterium]